MAAFTPIHSHCTLIQHPVSQPFSLFIHNHSLLFCILHHIFMCARIWGDSLTCSNSASNPPGTKTKVVGFTPTMPIVYRVWSSMIIPLLKNQHVQFKYRKILMTLEFGLRIDELQGSRLELSILLWFIISFYLDCLCPWYGQLGFLLLDT